MQAPRFSGNRQLTCSLCAFLAPFRSTVETPLTDPEPAIRLLIAERLPQHAHFPTTTVRGCGGTVNLHITRNYRSFMTRRVKTGFAGEVFDQRRSRSAQLAEYLLIYANYLPPENRTASNELVEFLEKPNPGQTIVYFGLSYYGKPCGFATLMLYEQSGLAIVDHIAIAPTVRGFGAFFTFCDLIAEYLERQKHSYNYIAAEIVLGDRPYTAGLTALTLLRLTRFVGFRLANIPYFAPDVTNVGDKTPNRAALMLLCQPDRAEIQANELLRIVRVIVEHSLIYRSIY
jgi:hypothetical protein